MHPCGQLVKLRELLRLSITAMEASDGNRRVPTRSQLACERWWCGALVCCWLAGRGSLSFLCIQFGYLNVIDDRYSNDELKSIAVGMSRADVIAKFGEPTTTALVIGNSEAVQWVRGDDEDLSSIAVVFVDGKVKEVIGTNLR